MFFIMMKTWDKSYLTSTIGIYCKINASMEPYIRKAIQNAVRIHAPNYVHIKTGGQSIGTDGIREFWISWYGLPIVKKYP